MPKPKIYLYAEILIHIRQLTLYASLETDKNEHTKILISSDKHIVTALHEGESSSIYLPTQISGTANVTFPYDRKTEISARLQIDDLDELKSTSENVSGIEVPWSAGDLTGTKLALQCKGCGVEVLEAGKINEWKDLPSNHWADLMDIWFCHKPHDDKDPDHGATTTAAAESKGFSAKSKTIAKPSVGLIDTVSFLLNGEDCKNLKEEESSKSNYSIVRCASCESVLGSKSPDAENSFRLYKSRLSMKPSPDEPLQQYPAAVFICSQLLSLIESSISRKVVLHDDTPDAPNRTRDGLLLWIFNPDIYYSSSSRGPTAHRAMKVFYKSLPEPAKYIDDNSNTHEELVVPPEDFDDFNTTLHESSSILPQSARKFQDWDVGLVDRWEKNATGISRMDENPLNKKVDDDFEVFKLPPGWKELYM